jgi:hypothetical protein
MRSRGRDWRTENTSLCQQSRSTCRKRDADFLPRRRMTIEQPFVYDGNWPGRRPSPLLEWLPPSSRQAGRNAAEPVWSPCLWSLGTLSLDKRDSNLDTMDSIWGAWRKCLLQESGDVAPLSLHFCLQCTQASPHKFLGTDSTDLPPTMRRALGARIGDQQEEESASL